MSRPSPDDCYFSCHKLAFVFPKYGHVFTPSKDNILKANELLFGMVAAEAAACGVWPIVANHSGLAEVSSSLASAVPKARSDLLSFDLRGSAVTNLASRICEWMDLPGDDRKHLSAAVSAEAKSLWSWEGVARNVVNAALGKAH